MCFAASPGVENVTFGHNSHHELSTSGQRMENSYFLIFYFHVVNLILFGNNSPRSRRKRWNPPLLRHLGVKSWGHEDFQKFRFCAPWGSAKIFQKVFSTSDSQRTFRVTPKSYTFCPLRWHMTPPLTPGIYPPPKKKHDHRICSKIYCFLICV